MELHVHLVILACIFVAVDGGCPDGWLTHDIMCYHFSHDTEDISGARLMCSYLGGRLVEIEDAEENKYLAGQISIFGENFWIGLNDIQEEDTWVWFDSGTIPEYTNWRENEPSNSAKDENCVLIRPDGLWNDLACHNNVRYICEKANAEEVVG